jgi:hypothetical protein
MQIVGFLAVIGLVGLMSLSGFQIVPDSAINRVDANGSGSLLPTISTSPQVATVGVQAGSGTPSASVVDAEPAFVPAVITGQAAQNIESSSALLRGNVSIGTETIGAVFFVYGYDRVDVGQSIAGHATYDRVLANKRTEAVITRAARSVTRDQAISTRVSNLAPDTTYYVRLCAERAEQLSCSTISTFSTIPGAYNPGEVRIPTVRVTDESAKASDQMVLQMTVAMRDTIAGDVYLVYGESQSRVEDARGESYSRIDEDNEQLQKTRIVRNIRGTQELTKTIDDLPGDTLLYYFVCVEYDGLRDGTVCTRTQSYRTYNEDYGTAPRVRTEPVVTTGTNARLTGSIAMRDFIDGKVFFVYGSDLERVTMAPGETTMERLRQTKDQFQRVLVDSDLDGNDTYVQTVRDLLPDTLYAARLCVEFENQNDNYRDVGFVSCGELQSFITQ